MTADDDRERERERKDPLSEKYTKYVFIQLLKAVYRVPTMVYSILFN